jgi:hypothetical protein
MAGDEDGAAAMAILNDLHEITPLAGREAALTGEKEDGLAA